MKQPAFLANAHDGFGVSFATTVACILSIVAISWHPWSQSEMLISEEHNPESSTDTYDAATNTTTTTYNQSGSEAVWGTQYLAKCPNCKKSSRLVMTRSPMDWCVSLRQVVFQPYDHRRRRMDERSWASSRLETHTNYTVWTNTSCVSDMEGSYVDDNFCNATWVDLRKDACDRADAAIASWPNATAYPYAFVRRCPAPQPAHPLPPAAHPRHARPHTRPHRPRPGPPARLAYPQSVLICIHPHHPPRGACAVAMGEEAVRHV